MPKPDRSPTEPTRSVQIRWRRRVAEHDYAAAQAYLSLKLSESEATSSVARLRKATLTERRANDILRAAGLTAAPMDDPGVMKDLLRVIEGVALSPILFVNSSGVSDIADGFHRVSLVYRLEPYGLVPLKIA